MRRIFNLFGLVLVLLTFGCTPPYLVEKDVPINISKLPGDTTGKTSISLYSYSTWEYVANDTDLFVLMVNDDSRYGDATVELIGVNREFHEYCYIKNVGKEGCKKQLMTKVGAERVKVGYFEPIIRRKLYIRPKDDFRIGKYLYVQYVDGTKRMLEWIDQYDNIKNSSKITDYFDYLKQYPNQSMHRQVLEDMFNKFFKVSVVKSSESKQRSTTARGLDTSSAGTCKDVIREIRVEPKTNQVPPVDLVMDVKYILNRTYEPYHIDKPGDPLYSSATYRLTAANGFTVNEKVQFDCVLTSGRFHSVAMSFLGRLAGAKSANDTGLSTSLTKLGFDIDIQHIGMAGVEK